MSEICSLCGCLGYVPPEAEGETGHGCSECWEALQLAQLFHETYERLAPGFDYKTRRGSAKPWCKVPENNRRLMVATCRVVLAAIKTDEERLRNVLVMLRDHLEKTAPTCPACRKGFVYAEGELRDGDVPLTQAERVRDLADDTDGLSASLFGWRKRREVTKRLREYADLLDRLGKPCYSDPDDPQPCREVTPELGACQELEEGGNWVGCKWGGQYDPPEEAPDGEEDADGGPRAHDHSGGDAG